MAERIKGCFCIDCIHLQRDDPYISGQMVLYKCSCQGRDGKVVGWVQKDNPERGLKQMGCLECNTLHIGDKVCLKSNFSDNKQKYLYCGKLNNRGKYLLYTSEGGMIEVGKGFFRGQTGKISRRVCGIIQNGPQLQASIRVAKKRKARWLENVKTCTAL